MEPVPARPVDQTRLWWGAVPDPGSDPVTRAALQEKFATMAQAAAHTTIQESYVLQQPSNPLAETPTSAVAGNLPIHGWTCQNATGSPFGPYAPTKQTPDWTEDPNSLAGGRIDQNQVRVGDPYDRDNIAPVGGAVYEVNDVPDPNFFPEDQGGTIGQDLEY